MLSLTCFFCGVVLSEPVWRARLEARNVTTSTNVITEMRRGIIVSKRKFCGNTSSSMCVCVCLGVYVRVCARVCSVMFTHSHTLTHVDTHRLRMRMSVLYRACVMLSHKSSSFMCLLPVSAVGRFGYPRHMSGWSSAFVLLGFSISLSSLSLNETNTTRDAAHTYVATNTERESETDGETHTARQTEKHQQMRKLHALRET